MKTDNAKAIEDIFYMYVNRDDYTDCEAVNDAHRAVNDWLKHNLSKKQMLCIDDLIGGACYEREKQGFCNGFQFAMMLVRGDKYKNE